MHIRVVAVGHRQPAWVDAAFGSYTSRFPKQWAFRCDAVPTTKRRKNEAPQRARDEEGERILSGIAAAERVVLLDETGRQMTSRRLARCLADWQADGRDVCFVIGGPDGVSTRCRDRADRIWSLSELTLPHSLVRILLAEQLYRAWSLQSGHPYHRA